MPSVYDAYRHIEYDSDGRGDYYDELMVRTLERDEELRGAVLSSAWTRGKRKKEDPKELVYDLLEIKETVRNLVKIHGVPGGTFVTLADTSSIGAAGAATFRDLPEFTSPIIYLDKSAYLNCDPEEILDVYCGIGLHEASHLNHTRKYFLRLFHEEVTGRQKIWEGLFEDERIEDMLREESPGFSPYLQAVKKALFDKKELGASVERWEKLADMDKINVLIMAFIRVPYQITLGMMEWTDVDGRCIYEMFRAMFPRVPVSEDEVKLYGEKLWAFWEATFRTYDRYCVMGSEDAAKTIHDEDYNKPQLMDVHRRLQLHKKAKEEDEKTEKAQKELEETLKRLVVGGPDTSSAGVKGGVSDRALRKFDADRDEARKLLEKLMAGRFGRRFGILELKIMVERVDGISRELSGEESVEHRKAEDERIEFGATWGSPDVVEGADARRTVITHPVADDATKVKYHKCVGIVRGHVQRMKQVFSFRLGVRHYVESELREGTLERRMLGRAQTTDRLFKREYTKTDKGIALCLVLDESGSMGGCDPDFVHETRATVAQKIAVLIAEALRGLPGVELEIYSYGSCGPTHDDCLIKYLYGKENPSIESLAGYTGSYQNYDHVAIKTCGDLFIKNTVNTNRMMIVLSDGAPAGNDYGGHAAIRATKKSVQDLERKGITVLNVAINSFRSEAMFRNVVKFLDLPDLINQMRRLITRVIKRVSGG